MSQKRGRSNDDLEYIAMKIYRRDVIKRKKIEETSVRDVYRRAEVAGILENMARNARLFEERPCHKSWMRKLEKDVKRYYDKNK